MTELEENKAPITSKDDIDNIEHFFNHFEVKMPEYLQQQIKVWKDDPDNYTTRDEEELRAAVSHALLTTKHKILKADVWKGILINADETYYNAQFDKDLEAALTEEE